ncbi:tetratricopeptide repeat protein, partial [Staphylococcus aureus]
RPDHVGALVRLFDVERRRGAMEAAVVWARRVSELQPDKADAFIRLGAACLAIDEPKQAIAALTRAVELAPDNLTAQRRLA